MATFLTDAVFGPVDREGGRGEFSPVRLRSLSNPLTMTAQGYIVTGPVELLPSYEAFIGVSQAIMVQYVKFAWTATETIFHLSNARLPRDLRLGPFIGTRRSLQPFSISRLARAYNDSLQAPTLLEHDCSLHQLGELHHLSGLQGSPQLFGSARRNLLPSGYWYLEALLHRTEAPVDAALAGTDAGVALEVIATVTLLLKIPPEFRVKTLNVTDLVVLYTLKVMGRKKERGIQS